MNLFKGNANDSDTSDVWPPAPAGVAQPKTPAPSAPNLLPLSFIAFLVGLGAYLLCAWKVGIDWLPWPFGFSPMFLVSGVVYGLATIKKELSILQRALPPCFCGAVFVLAAIAQLTVRHFEIARLGRAVETVVVGALFATAPSLLLGALGSRARWRLAQESQGEGSNG